MKCNNYEFLARVRVVNILVHFPQQKMFYKIEKEIIKRTF